MDQIGVENVVPQSRVDLRIGRDQFDHQEDAVRGPARPVMLDPVGHVAVRLSRAGLVLGMKHRAAALPLVLGVVQVPLPPAGRTTHGSRLQRCHSARISQAVRLRPPGREQHDPAPGSDRVRERGPRPFDAETQGTRRRPVAEAAVDVPLRGEQRRYGFAATADVGELGGDQPPQDPSAPVRGQDGHPGEAAGRHRRAPGQSQFHGQDGRRAHHLALFEGAQRPFQLEALAVRLLVLLAGVARRTRCTRLPRLRGILPREGGG